MSFPPPADATVDWSKLSLAVNDLPAGHIESRYSTATGQWSAPKFVEDPMISIHGLSPAFNYGMQAYEGLKVYRSSANKILLFRPHRHAQRMKGSTAAVAIPAIPDAHFVLCTRLAVSLNASIVPPAATGGCLYIRPVAFATAGHLALTQPTEFLFCVYVHPSRAYHGIAPLDALILDEFDRAAPRGTGRAKVGGNYAPVVRFTEAALQEGYPLTLHLDPATRTLVDEFSTSAFIGLTRGADGHVTLAYPDSRSVVDSVTADSAAEVARSFGWTVEQRPIAYAELGAFTEVLAAGTAASLVPVRSITRKVPSADGGKEKVAYTSTELSSRLAAAIKAVQMGDAPDPFGWTDEIRPVDEYLETDIEVVKSRNGSRSKRVAFAGSDSNSKGGNWSGLAWGATLAGAVVAMAVGGWRK